uniref:Transmembrane protein n=1 Tax=Cucumis sativus TaxID=3659 RepID=A0A0A0L653_CUCSA
MASPWRIPLLLKLLFFSLLLIFSTVSTTNNVVQPLFHKPRIRKIGVDKKTNDGKAGVVPRVIKPTSEDFPWGGGYIHPHLSNP